MVLLRGGLREIHIYRLELVERRGEAEEEEEGGGGGGG